MAPLVAAAATKRPVSVSTPCAASTVRRRTRSVACRAQSSAIGMGRRLRSACGVVRAAVDADADGGSTLPTSGSPATISIQAGDVTLSSGNAAKAVLLYTDALASSPNDDEARAALYNRACALTRLSKFEEAVDDLRAAVRDRRLKFSVALKDPDLASLRVRPEFAELSVELLGRGDVAAQVALRTEAKNPFRLLRLFVFGGVAMGSGIGAVVLGGRLAKALAGGDGAPGLVESGGNLAVNLGVGAACVALLLRELDQKQKQESVAAREEELGRLMVALGGGREAALAAMRGSYRPVVVAGSVGHLKGVLRAAEPYKRELQKRGVLVVPVPEGDDALARKKGFSPDASAPGAESPFRPEDRWRVAPVDGERWARWVGAQKQVASLGEEEPIYIAVAADGTVRRSGQGAPRWEDIVEDFPELDSPAAKLTGL